MSEPIALLLICIGLLGFTVAILGTCVARLLTDHNKIMKDGENEK